MNGKLVFASGAVALILGTSAVFATALTPRRAAHRGGGTQLEIASIHWEYNSSANDLGVHVSLDGEDWKNLKIKRPDDSVIFEVKGKGPYKQLGMTELFFEGAEPTLDDFPLDELLALFPEGTYDFEGRTVEGDEIEGESEFTHAIPAGPQVFSQVGSNDFVQISWTHVNAPPPGFPNRPIHIVGYQILVDPFEVTLPATATVVTLPPEFVASLAPGTYPFEVLAIEESGNQTITEGTFVK